MSWFEQNKHRSDQEIAAETDAVLQKNENACLYDAIVTYAAAQDITQEVVDSIIEKEFTGDRESLSPEQLHLETSRAIVSFEMLAAVIEQEIPALGKRMKEENGAIISRLHSVILARKTA